MLFVKGLLVVFPVMKYKAHLTCAVGKRSALVQPVTGFTSSFDKHLYSLQKVVLGLFVNLNFCKHTREDRRNFVKGKAQKQKKSLIEKRTEASYL